MSPPTFEAFAHQWISDYVSVVYKHSTAHEYGSIVRCHLIPWFKDRALQEIRPSEIQRYIATKNEDSSLSAASVRNHATVLRSMFAVAVDWGLVATNPADAAVAPRAKRADISFLTSAQMRSLIESTSPRWRALIATACLTGLRKGELLALRWRDLDLEKRQLHVRNTLYRGELQDPKTRSSTRTVPLPERLVSLLIQQERTSDRVFVIEPRDVNRVLSRALRRAALPAVRFHDLRHSFVAAHIEAGTPVKVIQSLLGHASIKTTMDTYGHLMPGLHGLAASALEDQVFSEEVPRGDHQA